MSENPPSRESGERTLVVSVDAMGGDLGPGAVVSGMAKIARQRKDVAFIAHGDSRKLEQLISRQRALRDRCSVVHADGVVTPEDKPSDIMRHGQHTSMWSAISSVREGKAEAAVSCGNTGALLAVSIVGLKRAEGFRRPAIAIVWPAFSKSGFNVLLDAGASDSADARDLAQFAKLGAQYARDALGVDRPRVGILNIGTEGHKGRDEIKGAADIVSREADGLDFEYVGYVEGTDIARNTADVIVTDGFTGNVALKTAEGTARFVYQILRSALKKSPLAFIGAILSSRTFREVKKLIDPRRVNGGVFLGLNGIVVKAHGSSDATGFSSALYLALRLAGAKIHKAEGGG